MTRFYGVCSPETTWGEGQSRVAPNFPMSTMGQDPGLAESSEMHPRHQEGNLPWVQNQHSEERCMA